MITDLATLGTSGKPKMPRNLPKYIHEFIDRHGRIRRYFRYRGKSTPVPYRPGNAAFDAMYGELLTANGLDAQRTSGGPRSGFVYYVRGAAGRIKIGFSEAPDQRIASLQTGHPERLEVLLVVPGTSDDERVLHAMFSYLRLSGEWFEGSPELLSHIEAVKKVAA